MNPVLPIANSLPLSGDYDGSSALIRRTLVASVLGAHMLAGWGLMQVDAVRQAVGEMAPMMMDLIAAPKPPAPPAPPPPPAPPRVVKTPPTAAPVIAAAPSLSPALPLFVVPPPSTEPAPPVAKAPAEPLAPPAPPPTPRTIPATAVQYLEPPAPVYPSASRRLGETGRVAVRVEIDAQGHARQVQLSRSSGSTRLDEAALAAVRVARFKPYTENGTPLIVWTIVPIVFELES